MKTAAANVALHKTAAASTGSQPAANTIDRNSNTRWESAPAYPQWISIDLGGIYKLESVVLNWEGAFGKAYRLQVLVTDKGLPPYGPSLYEIEIYE
ncbi:discoidin domain-containing protein [Candidatus Pristimantibacillus sp. PTI5]|uniref:discoidin domain-containing protein n=1 Tax=Candidatus Pristimantibacillus sp. PTI5 TaxID=3400422 RepID=UPI003B011C1D